MENTELRGLIDALDDLPTLPSVVVQLLELTQDDFADAASIARVIESDQTLTARILRLVNSSFYTFDSEVTTVSRAVAAIGLNSIRCIALGMGVARMFPKHSGTGAFRMEDFWKHSLACAVASKLLAEGSSRSIDPDEAFVAGLLHDIGKLVLLSCRSELYDAAVARAKENGLSLLESERRSLGASHTEAGKWFSERWGLPDVLTQAIWLHHQPTGSVGKEFRAPLIYTVQVADALAHLLRIGASGNDKVVGIDDAQIAEIGVAHQYIDELKRTLWDRVEEYSCAVDLDLKKADLYIESLERANQKLSKLSLKFEEQNRQLTRRERRFRALHEINTKLILGQSMPEVMSLLSQGLRDGYDITNGLCYVANTQSYMLHGVMWKAGARSQEFSLAVQSDGRIDTSKAAVLDPGMQMLLAETALQFDGFGWLGRTMTEIMRRKELLIVPMVSEGRSLGQLVLDFRGEKCPPNFDPGMGEIMAFASAAGLAVSRVQVHETLRRRSEELAGAIRKKETAYKELLHSERLAAVGKMAAGAAHEVNNPLAIISGRAQMMLQRERSDDESKQLQLIVDQCSRASKILNDLMRFARPALPKKEVVGVNSVVYEVLDMFDHRYEKQGISLQREFATDLPKVMIDKHQIQQVLVNLLINAEHAITAPGTVTVRTSLHSSGSKVCIAVGDTGCGIPREHLHSIFEPFFTTKEEGQGTGLGLSLAHGIVTSHQGVITVQSEVGKGTTFTISLPPAVDVANVKSDETPPETKPAVQAAPMRKRILVVDDEQEVRSLIAEAMSHSGYEVTQAENGLVALQLARRMVFDLMTVDIRMPRIDGMAMLRALRERGGKTPVVVITGMASDEEIDEARALGVAVVIRKPFEVSELLSEVSKALTAKR